MLERMDTARPPGSGGRAQRLERIGGMTSSNRGPRRVTALAAGLGALAVAGCGGDSDGAATTTTTSELEVVEVVLDDYRFTPATLSPGTVTVVSAKNLGGLEHSWSVLEEPIESELDLGSATVLAEARVGVGQSATVDIGGLSPGRYQVVCVIAGHMSAGMVGELVIDD